MTRPFPARNIKLFFLIIFSLLASLVFFNCYKREQDKFTIFFTNDLQAHIEPDRKGQGGLARIAYLVKKAKAENPNIILVDAGDNSVGTAFGTETKGESVFRVMNAVGYGAAVYGNHEFDLGAAQARNYQQIAKFPLLACNIKDKEGKPFSQEYAIFQMGEIRIGVIGVANPKTTTLVDPSGISGLNFLPPETEIRRIQNLLAGKLDVLIILSHQGLRQDLSLAYHISGIPLIIGGHSEIKLSHLLRANDVSIAQAGHNGFWLARIDLFGNPETKNLSGIKYKLIRITERIPEDLKVKETIEQERKNLPPGLEREIGKSWRGLSQDYIGYWTAELIKAFGQVDLGIINTAGIRSEISRGEISAEDIYEIMPFNDRIAIFEMDGYELLRLKSLHWFYFSRGPKISVGKTYKIASIDYLLKINDFPGARNVQIFDTLLRDKMIERIEKDKGFKRFWEK